MRRSVYFLTPLIPLALAACEDGPNQTFQPATGTLFNNGDTPAAVSDAGDSLTSSFGGQTKTQICSGDQLQKEWAAMINQPLAPVRFMAGLDMANGASFPLLTVEQAEVGPTAPIMGACVSEGTPKSKNDGFYGYAPGVAPLTTDPCVNRKGTTTPNNQTDCLALANAALGSATGPFCGWNAVPATPAYLQGFATPDKLCQPTVLGAGANGSDVGGSILSQWGNAGEFQMEWAVPTHKAYVLYLNPGYVGHMTWNYLTPATASVPAALHAYDYEISYPIKKDGKSYEIDWLDSSAYPNQVDELYRGIASTFAPDIYDDAPPGVTCNNTGTCLALNNSQDGTGRALFGMRPVSFYMFFDPPTLPNPSGFTVNSAYLFNIKYAPYSGISSYFKMYDGPIDGGGIAAGGDAAAAEPFGDGLVGNLSPQKSCHFSMGNNFQNLLQNCIDVFQVPSGCTAGSSCDTQNKTAEDKVLGDLSHDDQNYTFSVVGINQNFRPVKLDICTPALTAAGTNCGTDTQDVIHDTDTPQADPTNVYANSFTADVRSFGPIQNDYMPPGTQIGNLDALALGLPITPVSCTAATGPDVCNPPFNAGNVQGGSNAGLVAPGNDYPAPGVCDTSTDPTDPFAGTCVAAAWVKDLHGSGAVWREYGRLVQKDLNAQYVAMNGNNATFAKRWHDPTCYFPIGCTDSTGQPIVPAPPATTYPTTLTTCSAAGGSYGILPVMPMVPTTTCATAADCTGINPLATCNTTNLAPYGFPPPSTSTTKPGTCTVPFDVNSWRAPLGCTGFESWFTAAEQAPQDGDAAPTAADDIWDVPLYGPFGLGGGFKPGEPQGMFCNDPGDLFAGAFKNCGLDGDVQGLEGDLLGSSASRVLTYLGQGDVLNLPLEGRDRRYFFKQWSIAYAKYLNSPSVLDTGLDSANVTYNGQKFNGFQVDLGVPVEKGAIANTFIDLDNIIFDSFGGGASRSEFINFDLADANNDPLDVEQKVLILGTNLQGTNYYRKLDREERAIFNTLRVDNTQPGWAYLNDPKTGARQVDTWATDFQPATACAADADCLPPAGSALLIPTAPTPKCDKIAGDINNGQCVYEYPRHNGNPFITNMAGSAVLTGGDPLLFNGSFQTPLVANPTTATGLPLVRVPAPAGWVDPCNPVPTSPITCAVDSDCPGIMACSTDTTGATSGTCQTAVTAYYCATHSHFDAVAAPLCDSGSTIVTSWTAPLNPDNQTMARRANGKPLLEGYCSAWQPNPFTLTGAAVTPSNLIPDGTAVNQNPNGVAAGIQIVKTFPDEQAALVSLPTYQNPYAPTQSQNKNPVQVIVPWLPFQEGVGYPVATNGSQDIFVETAQLDFTGQVITPTMDFLPSPISCLTNAECSGGLTCQGASAATDAGAAAVEGQCLAPSGSAPLTDPQPPYELKIQAWETQDFLGEVFLCIDFTSSANRNGSPAVAGGSIDSPGDILSAHMYSSAETIVNWLASHPNAQNDCGIVVRYSIYDNYPDFITSLSGGVRLNIEQGAGYGRVVDAILFAPGTGVAASP